MNTWWYYYYSALLQINWNCHKALKSFSPNPVLLHSFVLKIAAAVWQFPLNFSTCPKTGTLCVKVGPKPAFIPLSNSCIQSYNSPGLLVEYIINMQQDPNALFSQSLGASSNSENKNCATVVENCLYFYFSDHDLCLLVTWSPCQVYGLLLSNQSEPPNVHKNWIPSQGKTKYKTSVSLSCILDFEIFFVCDVYRTFVPIKFSYISLYKHTVVKISTSNRAFWSFGRRETQRMAISIILSQPCCTQIILCGLRMIPFVSQLDCSMLL